MNLHTCLIVGKNGKTGRRVNTLITEAGYVTRAVSLSSVPSFDWQNPAGWLEVMQGCQSAYVCFQPDLAVPDAQQAIAEFIRQAKLARISHIVLLSGRGEEGAQSAEQLLINSGLSWNVVRASWFAQNFSEGFLIESILNGHVALPAGDVLEPFVDVDDIAEVAVACLTKPHLKNQIFEVTGPELLTFRDCVEILSQVTGKAINFTSISVDHFLQALRQQNMPQEVLWLMKELFTVVLDGRNSHVTNGVEAVLGRLPTSFQEYAVKAKNTGAWNSMD
ncbi:MAG: NmrA family transcriptional regulator [Oceanospirillaceae bacterium]|nr:NmrA family transcriptional regulator [Oceanospirillaceae bacterium]